MIPLVNEPFRPVTFESLIDQAAQGNWHRLPVGERTGKIATLFLNTPYTGGTLECEPEMCRVFFDKLDCVTFFETALALARLLRKPVQTLAALKDEISFTRYRSGKIDGYLSRLHYTSEWLADNEAKGVVKKITKDIIGGERTSFEVAFMSANHSLYPPLVKTPSLLTELKTIESRLSGTENFFIPTARIAASEAELQTGDIVAFVSRVKGMDYDHIGIACRNPAGNLGVMHASSRFGKVRLDESLHRYAKIFRGITVARPLEVSPEHQTISQTTSTRD
ncbi:MAG: DUF1460 domain-containing protein [Rhizobacter sp.]|nr:DUF1460 domain-containing protein [Chlorobiales bacterium]